MPLLLRGGSTSSLPVVMIIITGSENHSHCCCYCVKERFNIVEDADGVAELVSMQLNVGVLLVKANGQVALPHSMVAEAEEPAQALADFVGRLKVEPLLLKVISGHLGPSRAISGDLASRSSRCCSRRTPRRRSSRCRRERISRAAGVHRACKAARAVSCSCRTGSRRRTSRRTLSGRASR